MMRSALQLCAQLCARKRPIVAIGLLLTGSRSWTRTNDPLINRPRASVRALDLRGKFLSPVSPLSPLALPSPPMNSPKGFLTGVPLGGYGHSGRTRMAGRTYGARAASIMAASTALIPRVRRGDSVPRGPISGLPAFAVRVRSGSDGADQASSCRRNGRAILCLVRMFSTAVP